ncbi:MAG: hypothetical protein O2890_11635, partial [Cyanobacteria bacterium]|nr:hypothetical protein [Cyanobacteriota bacterium]
MVAMVADQPGAIAQAPPPEPEPAVPEPLAPEAVTPAETDAPAAETPPQVPAPAAPAPVAPAPVAPGPEAAEASPQAVTEATPPEPMSAVPLPPYNDSVFWNLITQGLIGLALLVVARAATLGMFQYGRHCRWRQLNELQSLVEDFRNQPEVQKVLNILDYEEYRLFDLTLPNGKVVRFEASDERMKRALRSHGQMVKTRLGLNQIHQIRSQAGKMDDPTGQVFERYASEEFPIELALRDWFDCFLMGLEKFETSIQAGLIGPQDLKPFVIYWIQLISDRKFRREGGSGFYDQLFHYIYWAGYDGVQRLFERYGYKILPPPYSTHDFARFASPKGAYDADHALCLAKAAHLVYSDLE